MFETLFFSDNMMINILVMIEMYWVYFTILFGPATYYIFLKIFTFPLITRKAHEFVLILSPESVKIKKIVMRVEPFFSFKKGLYWFAESADDENSTNKYTIYLEGINQPITEVKRNPNKLHDVTHVYRLPKQIASHKILLPIRLKEHLNRHFRIIINSDTGKLRLEPTKERQPLRVSFYHTLGIFIESVEKIEKPMEVSNEIPVSQGSLKLVQLTSQLMLRELKNSSESNNFSSSFTYQAFKLHLASEFSIVGNLSGSIDPKLIIMLIALMGVGAAIFFMFYYSNPTNVLGPMPT